MAAQLRAIRQRIRSIQSTAKITRAQELIASSRIIKAQQRVRDAAPYAREITQAVESMDLDETDGVTRMTYRLAFRDKAGRDHMTRFDGVVASFDNVESYLRSLLDRQGTG